MNQLRWDPTLREWVAYAAHRQGRAFQPPDENCSLCPTRPHTSHAIAVFENRFPSPSTGATASGESGRGVCEMVLYSDEHDATLARMSETRIANLAEVWADRYRELGALTFVDYVFVFEDTGAAFHHPHGQIFGYPFVPPRPGKELDVAREYHAGSHGGSCLHCDLLDAEVEDGRRVVAMGEHFVAFVPFYAHDPYEVRLYARRCAASIADLGGEELRDLARVLKRLLTGYDRLFGFSLPYVMAMHQAPTDGGDYDRIAHLHIEFYLPDRTADEPTSATGSGAFILDAVPEATAQMLRDAVEDDS